MAPRRTAAAFTAAGLASLVLSSPASAQPAPPPEPPAGRILYHEESGGMSRSIPAPSGPGSAPRSKGPEDAATTPRKAGPGDPAPRRKAAPAAAPGPLLPPPLPPPLAAPQAAQPAPAPAVAEPNPETAQRLRYAATLQRHAAAQGSAPERARALADEAGTLMVQFRDAEAASTLGWMWLEAKDPASASLWFSRARTWAPAKADATRGLAYAALAEKDFERALQLADEMPAGNETTTLRRDAQVGLAERYYRSERYVDAARGFAAAAESGELPRYARALHAWSLMNQGLRHEAGERFAVLYREAPDLETAQGLLAASQVQPIDPALAASEPLAGLLRQRGAQAAFSQRRFLEARALDAVTFGDVGAVTTPNVAAGTAWRDKSGSEGESRLRLRSSATLAAHAPLGGEAASIRARADRQAIDAGTDATRVTLESGEVALRLERGFVVEASLGRAAVGGPVGGRTTAALDVAAAPDWGQASLALTSLPMRESVLAFAGVNDVHGVRGRVFRHAAEARALWLRHAPYSLAGRAVLARLTGREVEDNNYGAAEVAAGYDLGLEKFSYAAASIVASGERFERNLSGFGPGQGGYFSPQRYRRLGGAFDFMTAERERWILRGRAAAGWVWKREDANKSDGHDTTLQLAGVVAVTPHVHAGFAIARSQSPQYRENQALVAVRVLLEPRMTVASADLPAFPR